MSGNLVNYSQRINAKALGIALAIFGGVDRFTPEHAERIYYAVDQADFGSDERKAELYSRLAESLTEGMRLDQAEAVIAEAMHATNRAYFNG